MSWKISILTGVVLGCVLGGAAYGYLCVVENMVEREVNALSYEDLKMSRGLDFGSYCGLEPESVCDTIDYLTHVAPYNVLEPALDVVVANDANYDLEPTVEPYMQPFGVGYKDELRAVDVAQPTYHPAVTRHGYFVQEATAKIQ